MLKASERSPTWASGKDGAVRPHLQEACQSLCGVSATAAVTEVRGEAKSV